MDRKTLLAMTLCLLIYAGWQKFYIEPHVQPQNTQTLNVEHKEASRPTETTLTTQSAPKKDSTSQSARSTPPHTPQKLSLQTGTGEAILGDSGSFFLDWNLKSYKLGISPEAAGVDINSVVHQKGGLNLAFDTPQLSYLNDIQGNLTKTPQGALWTYEDKEVKLTREFLASDQKPYVDVQVTAEFKSQAPKYAFISMVGQGSPDEADSQDQQLVYWSNNSLERIHLKDQIDQKQANSPVKYVGASNRYFVFSTVDQSPVSPSALIQPVDKHTGRISLVYPMAGKSISVPLRVYFGPKELNLLRQVEPTLDHVVDFGWFTVFAYPLLKVLKWLYQYVLNYGVAIILLTLLLKVLTYPLTYKSMKSMKNMAKLQPQLQKIRDKYKDDREALNREMLTLMKGNGYNPMAGCLPMIIQMPIFFALYRVLYSSIELYHAPFALWIHDLSSRDPFYVTPVLLSLTMFIQQKLTPNTATDPAQAKMMQLMPLIFGAFMLTLPSGLTIYMLVNAIASIVQQMILNKKLDAKPAR
jgi:YidC/Oxa1 family membrane protein insertase